MKIPSVNAGGHCSIVLYDDEHQVRTPYYIGRKMSATSCLLLSIV